jgi:hypothetical protein
MLAGVEETVGESVFFCVPNKPPAAGVLPEDAPSADLGGREKKDGGAGAEEEGWAVAVEKL